MNAQYKMNYLLFYLEQDTNYTESGDIQHPLEK